MASGSLLHRVSAVDGCTVIRSGTFVVALWRFPKVEQVTLDPRRLGCLDPPSSDRTDITVDVSHRTTGVGFCLQLKVM